jgi:hypothetical protein
MINNPENGSRAGTEIVGHAELGALHVVRGDFPRRAGVSSNEDTTPLTCRDGLRSINTWPEGVRRMLCLNCDRTFESDSKAQRLCRACR